jgi:Novel toxin 14
VTYVHLGWIAPGAPGKTPLWDEAMKTKDLLAGGDDPQKTRLELHARLAVMGPDAFIWKTGRSEYRFSEEFIEAFAKYRASRKPDLVKNLPVKGSAPHESNPVAFKNEYLNPTSQAGIGLRIGLHGGHSGLEKQAGMDRESHHTTQYLLVQFFRNDNKIKAWSAGKPYAGSGSKGIYPKTGVSRQYFEGDSKPRIKLDELDKGGSGKRGSSMPAILISADTHRRAQLHVEKESLWKDIGGDPDSNDAQGRITQGYAIQAQWKRKQLEHVGTHEDAADWEAKMKLPGAADKLHEAMIGVYHWMHGLMLPALEKGLNTRELAYYRAIASRIPGAANPVTGELQAKYDLSPSDMHAVFLRAKRNNNDVMNAAGWRSP